MKRSFERKEIERFRDVVSERLGLWFEDDKLDQLSTVLRDRMLATGCVDVPSYVSRLLNSKAHGSELGALAEELTVAETYFFRHAEQFSAFVDIAMAERRKARDMDRRLRVLSAGCSTGEEAYTVAILLRESLPDLSFWEVEIVGVDVNASVLAKSAQARYSEWSLRGTPEPIQRRYFSRLGREFVLDEAVRRMVRFEERNLIDDDPGFFTRGAFDVIFCRNVTMYFNPGAMSAVIGRLARSLVPDGFLFLGSAETLRGISQEFHLRHARDAFYYQLRKDGEPVGNEAMPSPVAPEPPPAPLILSPELSWLDEIVRSSERITTLANASGGRPPRATPEAVRAGLPLPRARPTWNLAFAMDLLGRERFQDAITLLRSLPPEAETDPDVLLCLAVVLAQKGEIAEAEEVCGKLLALDELNAGAHYLTALCREHDADPQGAMEHDQTAAYLDPAFAMPHLHLGMLAKRRGRPEDARREFNSALVLLAREDASRILLFGGGFNREALIRLCRAELRTREGLP